MKVAVFYDSITGNTLKLAKTIYKVCEENDITVKAFTDFDLEIMDADLVFVGSYVNNMHPSDKFKKVLRLIVDKKIFIFGTCSFDSGIEYYKKILKNTVSYIPASDEIVDYYYCLGRLPYSESLKLEAKLRKNRNDEKAKKQLENFNLILKHPDENDLIDLELKVKIVLEDLKKN